MPRMPAAALPQYIASNDPRGALSSPNLGVVDLRPVAGAAMGVGNDIVKLDQFNAMQQEQRRAQLEKDEASSAVHNTVSQGRAMWTEELLKAKSTASSAAGFTDGLLKRFDTWAETAQGGVPELAKPLLKERLGDLRSTLNIHAFEYEMKARGAAIVSDYTRGAEADALTLLADPSQITQTLAQRLALARTLDVPPEERATMAEAARHKLSYAAAQGLLRAPNGPDQVLERLGITGTKTDKQGNRIAPDPAKAAEAVRSDPIFSNMSPDHVRMIADQATMAVSQREAQKQAEAERKARMAEIEANRRARAADQAWGVLSTSLMAGHSIDAASPTNQALVSALNGTPYAAAYREMLAESAKRTAAALQPIPAQEAQLQSLYARRNAAGTSPELDAEIKRREGVLNAARKEYGDDPLMAATRRGVIQEPAPVQMANVDTMLSTIGPRLEQSDVVSTRTGRVESPLMSAEADALKTMFAGMTPDARGAAAYKIASKLGPEKAQALAKQMDDKDPVLSLALGTATQWTGRGRSVAELVFLGAQRFADTKTGRAGEKGDAVRQSLRSSMLEYLDGNTHGVAAMPAKAREKLVEAGIYINAGLEASGSDSGAERAMRLAVGGDMIDHNGTRIPVPIEVGAGAFRDRLNRYPRQSVEQQAADGFVYSTGGRPKGVPEFLADLPTSQLQAAGHGLYYVKSGAGYAVNQQGRPILIEVR